MTDILTQIPASNKITLIHTEQYETWLKGQNDFVQTWLSTQNYQGKGHSVVPDTEGNIDFVVFGISDGDDLFIAGDLPILLPPSVYTLDLESYQSDSMKNTQALSLRFAISWGLAAYQFERYKKADKALPQLSVNDKEELDEANSFISATALVRDLVNTPAGDMMPEDLSEECRKLCNNFGATLREVVGEELLTQNYPTIHAVGRASIHEPRLLDLRWGNPKAPKVTLVGKGVCFDSGGLDLKPSQFMRLMKKDMGGAAHVLGLAYLIMAQNLPVNLRVLIPAVENAVSSNAFRPGDVIKTRKGTTVEIDNTDAEGRLVLCDALVEADDESPDIIIDYATLTGACRVALGTELPGFFCNNDTLAKSIFDSGNEIADPVWQLPLHSAYQDMLKSDIADTLNSAASGHGGAITAALYLQLFVSSTTPWIHFDVMAWNNRKRPGRPAGGEAMGIRAVFDYLKNRYQA